jgi:hypothetical protein
MKLDPAAVQRAGDLLERMMTAGGRTPKEIAAVVIALYLDLARKDSDHE